MKKSAIAASLLALLTWNCSTELDVNAPYKEITIVYATLSTKKLDGRTAETTHYVKINRAFQGDGNALVYAAIPDSNEYTQDQLDSARVERWLNGNLVHTYMLNDTSIPDRLPGTFYYPEQTVYYFNTLYPDSLDQNSEYHFAARVKGTEVSATTTIVDDFPIGSNVQSGAFRPVLYNGGYQDYELKWDSDNDGRRYEAYYTFYYKEVIGGVLGPEKSFTRLIGSSATTSTVGGEEMAAVLVGEDFYTTVASQIAVDPNVERREFLGIRFHWAVANGDFHTFLLLSEPITGIVEDRPDFTNVTNGYGIFVSRYFQRAPGNSASIVPGQQYRILETNSLNELAFGQYTSGLGFCSPYPVSDLTPYACP